MEKFDSALLIYVDRPQVINRNCGGAVILLDTVLTTGLAHEINASVLSCLESSGIGASGSVSISDNLNSVLEPRIKQLVTPRLKVRKLISKQSTLKFPYEIILTGGGECHFIPFEVSESTCYAVGVAYTFIYDVHTDSVVISTENYPNMQCRTLSDQWLKKTLLPKIIRWTSNQKTSSPTVSGSMRLVDVDDYYSRYRDMKDRYGRAICQMWPECTDPLKFVYEDVAIACYLLCLWEKERQEMGNCEMQTFVDLGCGNGLLVYILSQEGHRGYGIDTRSRKIWAMFGDRADLREMSIIPSDSHLFPDADWLIGNHSDELTPWIPVIATRSSTSCRFFLLPCCPHDFNGKFQRTAANRSIYGEYMDYVCSIACKAGFDVERDSLRIPSTKKECIIGRRKSLSIDECKEIEQAIHSMTGQSTPSDSAVPHVWSAAFKPREATEKVRNCSTVSHTLQNQLIEKITSRLLVSNSQQLADGDTKAWNAGCVMGLGDVAKLFTADELKALKNECGGLKTLLKNHHHIFKVLPGAEIRLTNFSVDKRQLSAETSAYLKTRMCWFHDGHPDGCPLTAEDCHYAHGVNDLRPKPA